MCVVCVLTDAGEQIIEPLFGEERVLQAPEVKFENASHRIDVMIVLIIRQRVVSCDAQQICRSLTIQNNDSVWNLPN